MGGLAAVARADSCSFWQRLARNSSVRRDEPAGAGGEMVVDGRDEAAGPAAPPYLGLRVGRGRVASFWVMISHRL